jgi:hypothetical protein
LSKDDLIIEELDVKIITDSGKEVIGKIRIEMPTIDENKLVSFMMTRNILNEANVSSKFWIDYWAESEQNYARLMGSCIADCQRAFTDENGDKIKGRGACKAHCWVDTVVRTLNAIASILS